MEAGKSSGTRVDFLLKETNPYLGGSKVNGKKHTSNYDLVERMYYLYVHVVKAKDLSGNDITATWNPYVEIKLGNFKGSTRHFRQDSNPEWNQVFAFSKHQIQASDFDVTVKDSVKDEFLGRISFDMDEIPRREPPDDPLVPRWYRLEDRKGDKVEGEIMLAVWIGTQADEAFSGAWWSDAIVSADGLTNVRSKVYLSPQLWYLRVNVIEAQDLLLPKAEKSPEVFVRAMFGTQESRTRVSMKKTMNPSWNEDLLFVVPEPSEEVLILSVEDRVAPDKEEVLGRCVIPLHMVDRRLDHKPIKPRWYNLEKHVPVEGEKKEHVKFTSRIHMRTCLEGGYHVLDTSYDYSSDFRPTAQQLWKRSIGVLELGILSAQGLVPMKTKDGRGTTDAYCVAKYGQKWVRTRTITDSFAPRWNEQYRWDVFDPCTVVTIGVFDNCHLHGEGRSTGVRDSRIGKVRIQLSTLETGRVYTHLYPLLLLLPSGVKTMGEIHLAVRFNNSSLLNMMHLYSQPLLPKMHYIHPFTVSQLDNVRYQATQIVSMRLSCAEPPLRKEVVEYMLDVDSHMWNLRRSKANFYRVMSVLSGLIAMFKWFEQICNWKNPITTVLIHILFLILVLYPHLILPTIFLYLSLSGWWYYKWRPRHPPHVDVRLSYADQVHPDELDEEFDTFPTSRPTDIVRMRYDRLRSIAGRVQTVVGDLATQGERLQSLLSWRDPRATILFLMFCHVATIVLYFTPSKVVAALTGFYLLRHPILRHKLPPAAINFFRRLPARTHSML